MTDIFSYHDGDLCVEDVPLSVIAERVGTPVYVYSHSALYNAWHNLAQAFSAIDPVFTFAVKANTSKAIMAAIASWGGGADTVSGGEIKRALNAGIAADKVVFSGVGKSEAEIEAALKAGIMMFNMESAAELELINSIAGRLKVKAPVGFRVNPDVDARTHPKITTGLAGNKFGLSVEKAFEQYKAAAALPNIEIKGISCHIGSQITEISPFVDAAGRILNLTERLRAQGIALHYFDMGGGLGITYHHENPPTWRDYAAAVAPIVEQAGMRLVLEPGRSIVGNAGVLLTRVMFSKHSPVKKFVVVDAAMNDLMRPSLYDAYHAIKPLRLNLYAQNEVVDIVGPICETGDFMAKERELRPMQNGEYLAIMSAGAYGFSMASNYNSRVHAAEVMVKGKEWEVINPRQSLDDLYRNETTPAWI